MRYIVVVALLAITLGGCTDVPPLDLPKKGITVHHIINRIKCELIEARAENPELVTYRWLALGNIIVQVDDEGSLTPSVAFITPLAAAGTNFTFNLGAGITADRERIYSENISIQIADLAGLDRKPKTCDVDYGNPLLGNLGIRETINLGLRSLKPGGPVDFYNSSQTANSGAFGETIQFVLKLDFSGVGPTWTLVRFTGPGNSLAGGFRKDTNQLIISFAPTVPYPKRHRGHAAILPAFGGASAPAAGASAAAANNLLMLLQSTRGGTTRP